MDSLRELFPRAAARITRHDGAKAFALALRVPHVPPDRRHLVVAAVRRLGGAKHLGRAEA